MKPPSSEFICFELCGPLTPASGRDWGSLARVCDLTYTQLLRLRCRGPLRGLAATALLQRVGFKRNQGLGRVLVVIQDGLCVHFSHYFQSRLSYPSSDGKVIEIGDCWTDPDYRGLGLYKFAIRVICQRVAHEARVVMVVASDKIAAVKGAMAVGLKPRYLVKPTGSRFGFRTNVDFLGAVNEPEVSGILRKQSQGKVSSDKLVEEKRYSERVKLDSRRSLGACGAEAHVPSIRGPYIEYHRKIREAIRKDDHVLELCGGTGLHSITAAELSCNVVVTDISAPSLGVAIQRASEHGCSLRCVAADGERLPFRDGIFDVVLCAGGLSYCDPHLMFSEMDRVLRRGGSLIVVDSFNHNWIYRVNRYVGYLRGERSWLTLKRMPSESTVVHLQKHFRLVSMSYYGLITFLTPLLRRVIGEQRTSDVSDWIDAKCQWLRRHSFKVVIKFTKEKGGGPDSSRGNDK